MEVRQPMLDVGERGVDLRQAQPVTRLIELGARLQREPARALGGTLRVIDPGQEEQALPAPERLPELGEVSFGVLNVVSSVHVVAEQILDLARDRLALSLAEQLVF